jgi:hypothetical protein
MKNLASGKYFDFAFKLKYVLHLTDFQSTNSRLFRSIRRRCALPNFTHIGEEVGRVRVLIHLRPYYYLLFSLALQPSAGYGLLWLCSPAWVIASSFKMFLDHTQRRATVDRTPLDERSARRINLYLTTYTTDKRPCPRWDSKPRSQPASGRRPTPQTARPLGPAFTPLYKVKMSMCRISRHAPPVQLYAMGSYAEFNENRLIPGHRHG